MKLKYKLSAFFLLLIITQGSSQIIETIRPPHKDGVRTYVNQNKRDVKSSGPGLLVDPQIASQQKKWNIALDQRGVNHGSDIPQSRMDSIKRAGDLMKETRQLTLEDTHQYQEIITADPMTSMNVGLSFKGNAYNSWAPCDNSIAVSDDGYVVSVINTSILMTDANGNITRDMNFNDFLSVLQLTGGYFDPRVIYDPVEDKFILIVLNGNTPATSTIAVGFSTSGNPNENWWFYTFSGNPGGENLWLDYPNIGVSTTDLYISGNQFTSEGVYKETFIYQLFKAPGFTGDVVEGIHWYDVRDAYGNPDFTVVPISFGFDGSIGPGIFFISTNSGGGTDAMMYYTDNNSQNNPSLHVFNFTVPNYYVPFNGNMLGTTNKLKTNDCITQNGFYADGTIHFVYNNRGDDLHGKVSYCRLKTDDLTQETVTFGQQPYECVFPCVAPFASDPTDKSVLIAFVRTGGTIYPEFDIATFNHEMDFGGGVVIKAGEDFVENSNSDLERWGDYCGISRRHLTNGVEVWVSGGYGENDDNGSTHVLSTWIAQVTNGEIGNKPNANFIATPNTVSVGETVTFTDLSNNAPTNWSWVFPGGTPSTSNEQHPSITYYEPGIYDVTLTASNAFGDDEEMKTGYIIVTDEPTSVDELENAFNSMNVYPNPVSDDRITVEFEIHEATEFQFYIADNRGEIIKNLLHRRVKAGSNAFAFSTEPLTPGTYYLVICDEHHEVFRSVKFVVM